MRARVFEGERAYGGRVFKSTAHSERLKNSANILDFEIPYSVAEIDAAKQLVIDEQQPAGLLSPPDRLARFGDDGRVGADQHHPSGDRRLELAELFRSGREAEGHPDRHGRISAAGSGDDSGDGEGGRVST